MTIVLLFRHYWEIFLGKPWCNQKSGNDGKAKEWVGLENCAIMTCSMPKIATSFSPYFKNRWCKVFLWNWQWVWLYGWEIIAYSIYGNFRINTLASYSMYKNFRINTLVSNIFTTSCSFTFQSMFSSYGKLFHFPMCYCLRLQCAAVQVFQAKVPVFHKNEHETWKPWQIRSI